MNSPGGLQYSQIVATGRAVPSLISTNEEVERRCQLEAGWIEKRTGILQRPVIDSNQSVSDLARMAGNQALASWEQKSGDRNRIGMLILATSTPDHLLPPTAPLVASQLGLQDVAAFDIAVACSGFLYALQLADSVCRIHQRPVLLIAANVLSRRVSDHDPATAALFADGGGAAIVAPSDTNGILSVKLESDGSGYDTLQIPHGGSRHPIDETTLESESHKMKVNNGMAVFRYAVESMSRLGEQVLKDNHCLAEDLDYWIPHQANLRIIESVRKNLNLKPEQTGVTIDQFANSSAATIPIALDFFLEQGRLEKGNLVLLTAAAAGLTSGAALIRL